MSKSSLGYLFKQIYESSAGRIHWASNMWAIVGSRWDKKRIRNERLIGSKRVNELGEFIWEDKVVVRRLCVNRCPKPPGDDFVETNGTYWVPATECRKCPFFKKADRQFRFPRCTFGRADTKRGVALETLKKVNSCVQEAQIKSDLL